MWARDAWLAVIEHQGASAVDNKLKTWTYTSSQEQTDQSRT